ncbi:hypothetical protein [Amycolatopsis sp. WQ 127309]|uniref:hypothetical protein n=1 Tax=Amycolatopsis sp. WQ 127309 TaxID=2932773 RepID=UPI001FF5830C|nr:hypothetical protein [Amycolatopsis sp. WQ 127309]UOZ03677.1 hypothetical protein MUY22_33125 [Amycolatopsis sp. WQ 127309]
MTPKISTPTPAGKDAAQITRSGAGAANAASGRVSSTTAAVPDTSSRFGRNRTISRPPKVMPTASHDRMKHTTETTALANCSR